jgi:hypothetical protein
MLFCVGSSIKVARALSRHILALEADSKLFEEVLKKTTPQSKSIDMDMSKNAFKDDEDTLAMEQPFINLCE